MHCTVKVVKKDVDVYEDKEFINIWLKDKNIRNYDMIVFNPPPLISKKDEYNMWVDFKIKRDYDINKQPRDYFKEYSRYASRFQKPAIRTELCLIVYGSEEDGKDMLLAPIYNILGKYGLALDDANKLYDKHATFEKEKLFILINGAGGTANFNNCDVLKSRITDPELWVNSKGMDAYRIENRNDYDMTTNNLNVAKLQMKAIVGISG
ncbi:hypothetical protein T492DRAFT_1128207 [Pavlovales sp. CCMP2436]|nr:hypothetical protein T492DRAFT_1128207 [Pavlovales sp. CCMP2436]